MTNGIPPTGSGQMPPLQQAHSSSQSSDLLRTGTEHDRISTGSSGLPPEVQSMFDTGALDNTTLEGIQSLLDEFLQ